MLLPFVAWSLTGIFFLVRPGYQEAYETVPVQQYPISAAVTFEPEPGWLEIRHFRSVLGVHLLVRTETGWQHLDAESGREWSPPNESDLTLLLEDAFRFNPDRYGSVVSVEANTAATDTGVNLMVNWPTLSISQNGRDSRWIDRIYSIHYLEWTGVTVIERILGVGGLLLLRYMTYTGWIMAFRPKLIRAGNQKE